MKNNTETQIIITMKNVDHAAKITSFLKDMFSHAGEGGDLYLSFLEGEYIGHDIIHAKVEHVETNVIVDTLKWYADDYNYHYDSDNEGDELPIMNDCGKRAIEALKGLNH